MKRGSTAPAASFTIVYAPNAHSTTIDECFSSQTASIINILKHCIFQVHFPVFHAIITWQHLRHGRPKWFLNNEHAALSYSFTQIVDMNGAEKKYT